MSKEVNHGDSGIYTAEGNIAGSRAARMAAQREHQKAEFARQKAEIEAANARRLGGMNSKFSSRTLETSESEFKVRPPRLCWSVWLCVYVYYRLPRRRTERCGPRVPCARRCWG